MSFNGKCVSCRYAPFDYADEQLCFMCYGSPFFTKRRMERKMSEVKSDGGGLRFDEGKARVDLLPADALMELGLVYAAGDKKYSPLGGPRNWERGMPWSKALGPLMRHLLRWMMGETWDTDDKESPPQRHIAKVAWNAIALLTYELRGIGVDDRGVTEKK